MIKCPLCNRDLVPFSYELIENNKDKKVEDIIGHCWDCQYEALYRKTTYADGTVEESDSRQWKRYNATFDEMEKIWGYKEVIKQ